MMKTWPTAPLSVGTSKTWHCAWMSTGISWEQLFHDHVEGKADLDELAAGAVALRREIETGADHIRRLTQVSPM